MKLAFSFQELLFVVSYLDALFSSDFRVSASINKDTAALVDKAEATVKDPTDKVEASKTTVITAFVTYAERFTSVRSYVANDSQLLLKI